MCIRDSSLPDQFIPAVTELIFSLSIYQHDFPCLIDDDHCVRGSFQESTVPGLHLHQVLFSVLAFGDIANGCRYQDSVWACLLYTSDPEIVDALYHVIELA